MQELFETETTREADVVLPAASFAETDGTFTNNDGLVQRVRRLGAGCVEPAAVSTRRGGCEQGGAGERASGRFSLRRQRASTSATISETGRIQVMRQICQGVMA